jgi:protein-tyrosine phosphatase
MSEPIRILFLCMGNICRSPSAEGVFRRAFATRAPEIDVILDSAGTHDYHVGEPPDPRSIDAASSRGIDLSSLRARLFTADDLSAFDLILAMDRANAELARQQARPEQFDRIRLVMEFAPDADRDEVPDPYYGGATGFEEVLDLLQQAADGFIEIARNNRSDLIGRRP